MSTRVDAPTTGTRAGPFRDDAAVADGRRERLLARHREELATMPDEIRGTYVGRAARTVSALFASLLMLALVAASALPEAGSAVAALVPGRNPAVLSSLLFAAWLGGSLMYFLARARAERRFARVMARAVTPTADVHADVERMQKVHPEALARSMTQRLELPSVALPLLAAAVLVPCSAIYLCMALVERAYPRPAAFDDTLLAFAPQLVASAVLGIAAAVLLAPRLLRLGGNQLVQVRNTAFVIAVPALPLALWGLVTGTAIAAWAAGAASALSLLVLVAAQRVRSERARLGIADETTVAELTFRDLLRSIRTTIVALPATLNPLNWKKRLVELLAHGPGEAEAKAKSPAATAFSRPLPKAIAAACTAAILGTVAYSSISPVVRSANADPSQSNPAAGPASRPRPRLIAHGSTTVRVVEDHDDQRAGLVVEIQFRHGDPAEWLLPLAQPGAGFGWRFAVSVTLESADSAPATDDPPSLLVSPFLSDAFSASALPITHAQPVAVFNKRICSEEMGLGLRIVPKGEWADGTHTIRLRYEPFMSLADTCEPEGK